LNLTLGQVSALGKGSPALVNGLPSLRNWKPKAWTTDAADSVMRIDSTTFTGRTRDFDVRLSHKYLMAGSATKVELRAYSNPVKIGYRLILRLSPQATMDSEVTVELLED
jgi:hypothetical protein